MKVAAVNSGSWAHSVPIGKLLPQFSCMATMKSEASIPRDCRRTSDAGPLWAAIT